MGARLPRAGRPRSPSAPATDVHGARTQDRVDPRLPRRRRGGHRHSRTWSTCARPTSSPASCSPRPTCRRSSRSAPATSRPPATSRGRRPPTTTAPSSRDDELTALYAGEGVDLAKDTIAYCRIGERSAHTWFVLHELLGQAEREELRRLVDRVRLAGRRADRARRRRDPTPRQVQADACAERRPAVHRRPRRQAEETVDPGRR